MIRFIDVKTGNVYNGSKPYVHWFEGKQSVGLNYDKQFVILTDSNHVNISLDSEVFSLVDNHKIGFLTNENGEPIQRTFFNKEYYDLNALKTKFLYHPCNKNAKVGKYYVYTFNVIAQGKYVGEITDTLKINGELFTIGADFYDENEVLGINLSNLGLDMSNEIQRAIYEKDINEQKPDYVLLNRKLKELLNEYINILANKGSYKSLLSSLKWFEYGDLTKIYEYWKHSEPNKDYLSKKDITQFINKTTEELLYSKTKTTYISINTALNKIAKENGEIIYDDKYDKSSYTGECLVDEPNPKLNDAVFMFSKDVMSLKMTLLHNFFATYFLPIHLDLIYTTLEETIYSNTIKMITAPLLERFDYVDNVSTFKCELEKLYHLENVETFTNLDTPFGYLNDHDLNQEDAELEIIGVDTQFFNYETLNGINNDDVYKAYIFQHYKGIGTIIPFNCVFDIPDAIFNGDIVIYKNGELILSRSTTNIRSTVNNGKTYVNFNILLKEIGDYKIQLQFRTTGGSNLVKTFDFKVDEESYPDIKLYKIIPKDNIKNTININKWIQEDPDVDTPIEIGNIADYLLSPIQYIKKYYNGEIVNDIPVIYSQFISATKENIENTVHTNQVLIFKVDKKKLDFNGENRNENIFELSSIYLSNRGGKKYSLYTILEDGGLRKSSNEPIYNGYSRVGAKDIFWMTMDRGGNFISNSSSDSAWSDLDIDGNDYVYIIGINTSFNIPSNLKCSIYSVSYSYIREHVSGAIGTPSYSASIGIEKIKSNIKVWVKDMFIPYFYKLEEIGKPNIVQTVINKYTDEDIFKARISPKTYEINQTDVVCFLPDLKCVRRPRDFMWKFYCSTINKTIIPQTFRRSDMDIVFKEVDILDMNGNPVYIDSNTKNIYIKKGNDYYLLTETTNGITETIITDEELQELTLIQLKERIQQKISPNDNKNYLKTPYPVILQPLFGRYDFEVLPNLGYYDIIFSYRLDDNQDKDITRTISSQFLINKSGAIKFDLPELPKEITDPDIPVHDEIRLYLEEILRRTNAKYGFRPDFWEL